MGGGRGSGSVGPDMRRERQISISDHYGVRMPRLHFLGGMDGVLSRRESDCSLEFFVLSLSGRNVTVVTLHVLLEL